MKNPLSSHFLQNVDFDATQERLTPATHNENSDLRDQKKYSQHQTAFRHRFKPQTKPGSVTINLSASSVADSNQKNFEIPKSFNGSR